jgi:hypothetical protein
MSFLGEVRNGVVVLEPGVSLGEGTRVRVEPGATALFIGPKRLGISRASRTVSRSSIRKTSFDEAGGRYASDGALPIVFLENLLHAE